MTPDMKNAVYECLSWYFDQIYDPSPEDPGDRYKSPPLWVLTMIEEYAIEHGVSGCRESWEFVLAEIDRLDASLPRAH